MMADTTRKAGVIQGSVLIICTFLPVMGIVALMPVLPTLMKHFSNVSHKEFLVPMLLTAPSLCIAFLAPVAGYLSDRFGRRKLLLSAMLLYGFGGVMPFFLDNFYAIVGGRFCLGIAESIIFTIGYALFADYYTDEERKKWISIQGVASTIMGTFLLLGSGYLASIGWKWPFIFYALAFPMFVLGWIYLWEPERKQHLAGGNKIDVPGEVPWKIIVIISTATLITSIVFFVYTIHYSLILDNIGLKDQAVIGRFSAVASIFVPLGALVYRKICSDIIQRQLLLVYFILGLGLIGIGLIHNYHYNIVAACVQQFGCGMTVPVLSGWSLGLLPPEHRGRGMGFWTSCLFLGQFICPLVVTLIHNALGSLASAFVAFGILCMIISIILLAWIIIHKRRPVTIQKTY
jgi:MFS family permease